MTEQEIRRIRFNTTVAIWTYRAMSHWRELRTMEAVPGDELTHLRWLLHYMERYREEREWKNADENN